MTTVERSGKGRVSKRAKPAVITESNAKPSKAEGHRLVYSTVVRKGLGTKKLKAPIELVTIFGRMGRLLGERIESEVDVVRIVNMGLPSSALDRLVEEIDVDIRLIGSETTVRRRIQEKQHFTVDESERLVRLARITSMAEELFGGTKAATAWLSTRSEYLPGSDPISPLELSATDSGARVVESMMLRTAHGIF